MRGLLRKASAYYHTAKYLSAWQIGHRLKLMALKQFDRRLGRRVLEHYRRRTSPPAVSVPLLDELGQDLSVMLRRSYDVQSRTNTADALLDNSFTFLRETRVVSGLELWRCPEASQLWRYHAHYFDYTLDLAVAYQITGRVAYYRKFRDLAQSWMENNWPGVPDAWHPYPLSLRTVNWLYALSWFRGELRVDGTFRRELEASVQLQLCFLENHLEHDVRGNHLIKNAKALVVGALHFGGSAHSMRWLEVGLEILVNEAAEQALTDGGHFERSWLYHLIVLQDYAEIARLLRLAGRTVPHEIESAVKRMASYLQATLHPDADIPLFGDSELLGSKRVASVLALAESAISDHYGADAPGALNILLAGTPSSTEQERTSVEGALTFPQTGYFGFRRGGDFLIVDCGEPCPPYLPAHAHSDMLSFELSIAGQRLVVDAGTFEYGSGPDRQAFRSTSSHNTLIVNNKEQSEAWGAFRLARRATVIRNQQISDGAVEAFIGAYHTPVGGFVHQRAILWVRRSYWVVVDQVWGKGLLEGRNQLLLSPDWSLAVSPRSVTVSNASAQVDIRPLDGSSVCTAQGWYAPTFGKKHNTTRVLLQPPPMVGELISAYVIAPKGQADSVLLTSDGVRIESGLLWNLPSKPSR